jgi:hypothetical protein
MKQKNEKLIILITCFLLVFAIYGRTLAGNFVFDDRGIIEHQYLLSDFSKIPNVLSLPYWTKEAGLYRPITLFSYTLNFLFLGNGALGFHLINIILYALTGYLIFLFIRRIFKQDFLAVLTAVLFIILPIHSEAVANIIGRAEILALFFSLLALSALISDENGKNKMRFAGVWFFLAMGSKETAIAVLPVALAVAWINNKFIINVEDEKTKISVFERGIGFCRQYWSGFLSLAIGLLAYFLARYLVLGRQYFLGVETSIVENPLKFVPFWPRIFTAFKITGIYFSKIFWPLDLCSDYSYNQIPISDSFWQAGVLAGFFIIIGLFFAIFYFWRRRAEISFGVLFFILSFILVSNFIFPIGAIAGERLVYFASLGICLILASVFACVLKSKVKEIFKIAAFAFLLLIIIFYSVVSFKRAGDWQTEKKLFASAARCAPNSVLSRSNLGAAYYLEKDYKNAEKELLAAEKIYDSYPKGVNNLGLVFWKKGEREKAREYFLRALSFRFPYYGAYENLALMALEDGNMEEAKKWLKEFYLGNEDAAEKYIKSYQGVR